MLMDTMYPKGKQRGATSLQFLWGLCPAGRPFLVKIMKSILFARVSSREQEETGYSLPSQEKLLKEYSGRCGFEISKIFSISESASGRGQRKTFNEMLNYAEKNNIKIIVCEKVDRLTRNLKDASSINEWINEDNERQIHFVKENCIITKDSKSNEKFMWNVKVSIAQYYTDNLSEEVKKGQMEKIRQGWFPAPAPTGYKTIGESGHKTHIIDDEKAPMIIRLFELYATGHYSLKELSEIMYQDGFLSKTGKKMSKSRINDLLTNPFYRGKIRWNRVEYDGNQEPLISNELFDQVQKTLKSKTTPKYTKHNYLFRGLIKCAGCNGKITWEKQKGIIYGHCNHYRNCEQKTWSKEPEVEQQITDKLKYLKIQNPKLANWIRDVLKEAHQEESEYHKKSIKELNKQHQKIQQRIDKLYDDKLDEKIDESLYKRKYKEYVGKRDEILESIKKHTEADKDYVEASVNIYDLSQRAPELYLEANKEDKRKLIDRIFNNLTLNEGKLDYEFSPAYKLLTKAVEITNSSKVQDLLEESPNIFEPPINLDNINKNRALHPTFDQLLGNQDSNLI